MGLPDRPENLAGASWMWHAAKPYRRSPKDGGPKNFACTTVVVIARLPRYLR